MKIEAIFTEKSWKGRERESSQVLLRQMWEPQARVEGRLNIRPQPAPQTGMLLTWGRGSSFSSGRNELKVSFLSSGESWKREAGLNPE